MADSDEKWVSWRRFRGEDVSIPALLTGRQHRVVISRPRVTIIEIDEAHFRKDSAMFLAEGTPLPVGDSAPSDEESGYRRRRPRGIAMVAAAIRHSQEYPEQKLALMGHADPSGSEQHNQTLSDHRAAAVYALVVGERELFGSSMDCPHISGKQNKFNKLREDRYQILDWVSQTFHDFRCSVASHDGVYDSAVRDFQTSYNTIHSELNPASGPLGVDGDWGPLTCQAVFDLYQYELAASLGEDLAGLRSLQDEVKARVLKVDSPYIGCGEHHPAPLSFPDGNSAEAMRRVDILFVQENDEPSMPCVDESACDPERCELYDADKTLRLDTPVAIRARWERAPRPPLPSPAETVDPVEQKQLESQWAYAHPGKVFETEKREFVFWNYFVGSESMRDEHFSAFAGVVQMWQKYIKDFPDMRIKVLGYSSSSGDPAKNNEIALKRAEFVKQYLSQRSPFPIDASRIEVEGRGADFPLADDSEPSPRWEENMARNRRVEVFLYYDTEFVETVADEDRPTIVEWPQWVEPPSFTRQETEYPKYFWGRLDSGAMFCYIVVSDIKPGTVVASVQFITHCHWLGTYQRPDGQQVQLDWSTDVIDPFMPLRDFENAASRNTYEVIKKEETKPGEPDGGEKKILYFEANPSEPADGTIYCRDKVGFVFPKQHVDPHEPSVTMDLVEVDYGLNFVTIFGVRRGKRFSALAHMDWGVAMRGEVPEEGLPAELDPPSLEVQEMSQWQPPEWHEGWPASFSTEEATNAVRKTTGRMRWRYRETFGTDLPGRPTSV